MTSRGILECALSYARNGLNTSNPRAEFNASEAIEMIGKIVEVSNSLTNPDTLILYNIFKHCGITTGNEARKLYSDLSQDIHDSPWYELSIRVVKDRLTSERFYAISRIATDIFSLNIVITT
jgi:hypothetical protein